MGAVEGRIMQKAKLVEGVVGSTRGGGPWKVGLGGAGLILAFQKDVELHPREDCCQAPPALTCLCQKKFMPLASSIYACRDICQIPWEKRVAYAWALQHCAEKTDPPAEGKPHLVAESVRELREKLGCYLSFSNEVVFKGLALPEETFIALVKEMIPPSMEMMPACTHKGGANQGATWGEKSS